MDFGHFSNGLLLVKSLSHKEKENRPLTLCHLSLPRLSRFATTECSAIVLNIQGETVLYGKPFNGEVWHLLVFASPKEIKRIPQWEGKVRLPQP
jgi:hypothetical protein